MKLSIIIPVYNEERTISAILDRLFMVDFGQAQLEVVVVDDGSTDNSVDLVRQSAYPLHLVEQDRNRGKSAAIRKGLEFASGDYVIIQDADMEYDPTDINRLFTLAYEKQLPAVYGSRRLVRPDRSRLRNIYYIGGVGITLLTNFLYLTRITDEPTCYKLIRTDLLKNMNLKEDRFGFCPEVTSKLARHGHAIHEIPISYAPRTAAEGKKIKFNDAVEAAYILVKNRVLPKRFL